MINTVTGARHASLLSAHIGGLPVFFPRDDFRCITQCTLSSLPPSHFRSFLSSYRHCSLSPSFDTKISKNETSWASLSIALETRKQRSPLHRQPTSLLSFTFARFLLVRSFIRFITPVHLFPLGSCFLHTVSSSSSPILPLFTVYVLLLAGFPPVQHCILFIISFI
jgi:hypothetical protein